MIVRIFRFSILLALLSAVFSSCRDDQAPKPRGYYRIGFPVKAYKPLEQKLPYSFQVPVYSVVTPDLLNLTEKEWITVEIPANHAQIHISYKKIDNNLAKLMEESRKLVYNHTGKASSIDEKLFLNPRDKIYGTVYTLKGNAASPMQFYLTDSVRHFLRGALYIKEVPNYDSLKPVIQFLSDDVVKMIESTKWEPANAR
jgi:gliding motility-associated lipoprotein GldD